ncbi:MAG: alpha/beta hydrolase-fold protein [Steroidobacteraceae bacterium]|jgi:esterase/lipase superfamily enzyme|nr:alpha/beta hydrolase-fold protein [Steroidobacteraceae bacterium]
MQKQTWTWNTPRLPEPARVVRWGHYGTPVLLFPTAGGDFEEVERFHLVGVLGELIDAGRIKVYSIDSVAGKTWLRGEESPEYCSKVQNLYDAYVYEEVVPLIRRDCNSADLEVIVTGASIGAFNAVASICRHPDAFRLAIGMSGTYDLSKYLGGRMNLDFYFSSPVHWLPGAPEGAQLDQLRRRLVLLPTGEGRWEDVGESWRIARLLGAKGVPNRVDPWGPQWDHDWNTWRAMLPKYLAEHA